MIMIIALAFATLWFVINGIIFSIDYYTARIGIVRGAHMLKYSRHNGWKGIIIIIYTTIVAVFSLLDFKLLSFHIYLIRNNMRTYDYIIQLRESKGKTKVSKSRIEKAKITPIESPLSIYSIYTC